MLSRFDVIGRAKLLGCEISKNQLITSDGYTLTLHHLHPKRLLNHSESRFPVLLVSGLLCDANIFFIPPPNRCLPYILSSLGYDVWIGNVRGTYYSGYKEQIVKKSKSHFWDFCFDDIAQYDVPAMIKYILHATNTDKITYIGHSQGSLILLAALSNNPKLNRLINCCFALGPASRLANIKGLFSMSPKFLRYIMVRNNAEPRPFMFMNENRTKYLYKMLMMLPYTLCLKLLMQVTGNNPKDFDKSQFKDVLLNVPSPTSVKNIQHFLQMVDSKRFTKYDYGEEGNRKHYGQFTAPEYNLKTISIPVYLFSGEEDYLTTPEDIDWLANQLQNAKLFRYQRTAHLDYVIGKFSSVDIFEKIIELLTENETNTVNTPSAIEVK